MSFDVTRIDPSAALRPEPVRPAPAAPGAGRFASALAVEGARLDAIPASPPPELREQVLAAQRVVEELHARGRELHFEMDGGRVKIELRDLDGNVLREIPPSAALEIASGARKVS
jgi:hypothetical protein